MDGNNSEIPPNKHRKLDKKTTNPDEMAPFFPEKQLECLLNASIDLCEKGTDVQNEACQRLFRESLITLFTKILTGDAVSGLTPLAHDCINTHCEKLVKLCVHKLDDDYSLPLLELLAIVFDPRNMFHTINAMKQSRSVPSGSDIPDRKLYARPPADPTNPRGWLVDLINKFGDFDGFSILLARFQGRRHRLTIPIARVLLRPFGLCHELLTVPTIEKYLLPIVECVREFLDKLTDEELMKEAQNPWFSHEISSIMQTMTSWASRVPQHKDIIVNLESSRLKMILRHLEIAKNVQELLGNIVNNLRSSEGLENFFQGFQRNWTSGGTVEREKLLYFIRRLLAYDQDGAMMDKVLTVFWNVAHSEDVSTEVMELALETHLKLLDHPGAHRDALKNVWLDKCIEELKSNSNWILPAIKQIRKICNSLFEAQANRQPNDLISYKKELGLRLIKHHSILSSIENSLNNYINKVRELVRKNPDMDETIFLPDGRYNHVMQIQKRLDLYTFVLRHAGHVLNINGAKTMWQCLGKQPVFFSDREACLKWFIELISAEHSLINRTNYKDILEQVILQLDPTLLTDNEFTCFDKFFKEVNIQERKLTEKKKSLLLDDVNLIGKDYLWRIITNSQEDIAQRGIKLLLEVHNNPESQLPMSVSKFQMTFVAECTSRLQKHCDTLLHLTKNSNFRGKKEKDRKEQVAAETMKINRIKDVQKKFVERCNVALPEIDTDDES